MITASVLACASQLLREEITSSFDKVLMELLEQGRVHLDTERIYAYRESVIDATLSSLTREKLKLARILTSSRKELANILEAVFAPTASVAGNPGPGSSNVHAKIAQVGNLRWRIHSTRRFSLFAIVRFIRTLFPGRGVPACGK